MARKPPQFDPRDARIRKLEDALYVARSTIVDLMPEHLREPLEAATWCSTFEDLDDWQAWAVAKMVAAADQRPGH